MAGSNKTGLVPLRGPSLPLCVIVRIERDPGTRQWPSTDSPSTAVRRCHLAGVYCRNPLDHLPFLNRAIRFGWSASTSHFTACRVRRVRSRDPRQIISQKRGFGKRKSEQNLHFSGKRLKTIVRFWFETERIKTFELTPNHESLVHL